MFFTGNLFARQCSECLHVIGCLCVSCAHLATLGAGRVIRLHVVLEGVRWVEVGWVANGGVGEVG